MRHIIYQVDPVTYLVHACGQIIGRLIVHLRRMGWLLVLVFDRMCVGEEVKIV
jgi:hypothetical protein